MTGGITCVVGDDHPAVVDSVSRLLAKHHIEVVGRAYTSAEAVEQIGRLLPRVAVLDLMMPGPSAIEVARRVSVTSPQTQVILYTGYADGTRLAEALEGGVRGVIVKDAPLVDLIRAIEMVAAGQPYIDPTLAVPLVRGDAPRAGESLTETEREIVRLLADGATSPRIQSSLGMEPEAVRLHLGAAMKKLRADTHPQAIATALRRCLID